MESREPWYVAYTRSRQEKILAEQLEEAGYTVYLPLVKKTSQWSDRKKTIETPLFQSYVFIKGVCDKFLLKDFRSFVGFIRYNGKPAVVRQHEIDTLRSVIRHGYDVRDTGGRDTLTKGSKVQVVAGPLKGVTGELVSLSNAEWFIMTFEDFGNTLHVRVPARSLKKI